MGYLQGNSHFLFVLRYLQGNSRFLANISKVIFLNVYKRYPNSSSYVATIFISQREKYNLQIFGSPASLRFRAQKNFLTN